MSASPGAAAPIPVSTAQDPRGAIARSLGRHARWRWWEFALIAGLVLSWFVLPQHALILKEIAIVAIFAMSLDLVLGYAGVVSLGHTAFFGFGAYGAALFAKHVMPDPWVGLAFAIGVSTLLGAVTSVLILRGSDLTRLMVTLGVASILYELANKLDHITGGADGLQGVVMGPLLTPFGAFDFDLSGRVAYAYALAVLIVVLFLMRHLVLSPFGASLQALRDNRLRATSIGISTNWRLVAAYTVAGGIAGAAGALQAQTGGFASLDVFDFHRSAEVLLVLVVGGTGYLYGGIFGAIVFTLLRDLIAAWTPQYWNFWLGLFLVVLVLVGRDRFIRPWTWFGARR
ncbi:branched-chain amino acid ABC transporter permease [Piscinibacter koreensis]|uniref:Branched-chain amino acid ABC transporter permease n=1 Tax=Piscinibacter koreensis TaxID=2742824 RepID=A0A7Y6TVC0_9BURK|nr:branched-chain amino acid ABC transporter permease [Schlegelella koreensis]NUZ04848.1 branched-chain amino acid ABC transporter permease [Schlegelella koreensis]